MRLLAACVLTALLCACADSSGGRFRITESIDSLGTTTVVIRHPESGPHPEWVAVEQFSTASNVLFYRVTGARITKNDEVVVANSGMHEVIVLAPDGRVARRFGRQGDGPGEFRELVGVDLLPSGDIATYDSRLARITVFDSSGVVMTTTTLPPAVRWVDLRPLTFSSAFHGFATHGMSRLFRTTGIGRDSVPLLRFEAGELVDTLGWWAGEEWAFLADGSGIARAPVAFSRRVLAAGRNGRVAIGSTDSIALSMYDDSGRRRLYIVVDQPNPPVPADVLDDWREDVHRRFSTGPSELREMVLANAHRTYPAFDGLLIDTVGRIWLGTHAAPSARARTWLVISTAGRIVGGLSLPVPFTPLDATSDRIVGVETGDFGERIVLYRVGTT